MHTTIVRDWQMPAQMRHAVARYRHRVFVDALRWDLPSPSDLEQDEFDVACAVHLLVHDERHSLIGYARLMPTVKPYLLATHFSSLVQDRALPCDAKVWELSRYSAHDVSSVDDAKARLMRIQVGKCLLLEVTQFIQRQGGTSVVFCTTTPVQRLAKRWGVDIDCMGEPQHDGHEWLVAAQIHCNHSTVAALTPPPSPRPLPARLAVAAEVDLRLQPTASMLRRLPELAEAD